MMEIIEGILACIGGFALTFAAAWTFASVMQWLDEHSENVERLNSFERRLLLHSERMNRMEIRETERIVSEQPQPKRK